MCYIFSSSSSVFFFDKRLKLYWLLRNINTAAVVEQERVFVYYLSNFSYHRLIFFYDLPSPIMFYISHTSFTKRRSTLFFWENLIILDIHKGRHSLDMKTYFSSSFICHLRAVKRETCVMSSSTALFKWALNG